MNEEIIKINETIEDLNYMFELLDQRGIDAPRTLNCYVLGDECTKDELEEDLHVLFRLVDKNVFIN